jgi:hypothetical protein
VGVKEEKVERVEEAKVECVKEPPKPLLPTDGSFQFVELSSIIVMEDSNVLSPVNQSNKSNTTRKPLHEKGVLKSGAKSFKCKYCDKVYKTRRGKSLYYLFIYSWCKTGLGLDTKYYGSLRPPFSNLPSLNIARDAKKYKYPIGYIVI